MARLAFVAASDHPNHLHVVPPPLAPVRVHGEELKLATVYGGWQRRGHCRFGHRRLLAWGLARILVDTFLAGFECRQYPFHVPPAKPLFHDHRPRRTIRRHQRLQPKRQQRRACRRRVADGGRGTFLSWCAENRESVEIGERCLGHKVGTKVTQSYNHYEFRTEKAALLQRWADYLTAPVTPLQLFKEA